MAITKTEIPPRRLSIMAGKDALPLMVLEAAREAGWAVQYQSFVPRPELTDIEVRLIDIAKPLDIVLGIRRFKATHICMVGAVHVSDKGREGFFKLLGGKKKPRKPSGDSGLSKLGRALEVTTGATLLGAHEIVPGLLAEPGHIAGPKPDKNLVADGLFALKAAISAGQLDLGQALVCSGHRVVAVEDIAGTDALLRRVADHRAAGLVGDGGSDLVLAKARKPNQPMFVDLPAIGPGTVIAAHAAGLRAIFVQAGNSVVIERERLQAKALELGVSVYGGESDHD